MAPVYNPAMGRCIDRDAVALVAQAQRLPLNRLNWCRSAIPAADGAGAAYATTATRWRRGSAIARSSQRHSARSCCGRALMSG
jgi:hypothetical protein